MTERPGAASGRGIDARAVGALRLMAVANAVALPLGVLNTALVARLYGVGRAIELNLVALTVPTMLGTFLTASVSVIQSVAVAESAPRGPAAFASTVADAMGAALLAAVALVGVALLSAPLVVPLFVTYAVQPGEAFVAAGLGGVIMASGLVMTAAANAALAAGDAASPPAARLIVRVVGVGSLYPLYLATPSIAPNASAAVGALAGAAVQLYAIRAHVRGAQPSLPRAAKGALALVMTDARVVAFRLLDQLGTFAPVFLASRFAPGTYVVYTYAQRLVTPLHVLTNGLVSVLVPSFARTSAERGAADAAGEARRLANHLLQYGAAAATALIGAVPLAATLLLRANTRGGIPLPALTLATAALALATPIHLANGLVGSFAWAHRRFDAVLYGAALTNTVVAFAVSLAVPRDVGAAGLAAAQGLAYVLSLSAMTHMLRREGDHLLAPEGAALLRAAACAAVVCAAAYGAARDPSPVALVAASVLGAGLALVVIGAAGVRALVREAGARARAMRRSAR